MKKRVLSMDIARALCMLSIGIWFVMNSLHLVEISKMEIIKQFFPIVWGNWYVVNYCIFYLFVPFINKWILSMEQKEYNSFLAMMLVVWSIIPTFTNNAWSFGNLIFFFVMYCIGAYIKLYVYGKVSYRNRYNLIVALLSIFILILSVLGFDFLGYIWRKNELIHNNKLFRKFFGEKFYPNSAYIENTFFIRFL